MVLFDAALAAFFIVVTQYLTRSNLRKRVEFRECVVAGGRSLWWPLAFKSAGRELRAGNKWVRI